MPTPRSPHRAAAIILLILFALPLSSLAQTETAEEETQATAATIAPATSATDRLFLGFIPEAALARSQWWEGQFEYADYDALDVYIVRGVVAFQPWKRWEMGARVGFGNTDTPAGVTDGTGATDLDAWAKYFLGKSGEATEFAAGGWVTVPTGDDAAGLGYDAFSVAGFGSLRHRFQRFVLSVHAGIRSTGDGQMFGVELNGKTSPLVGVGMIFPRSDRVALVAEASLEGERFEGGDSDVRVLGGLNWRFQNRGMFRAAIAIGLSDGGPDAQLIGAYAWTF